MIVSHLHLLQMRREGTVEVRKRWSALATCICSTKWLMWQLHNQDQKVVHGKGLSALSCQPDTVPVTPQASLLETWSVSKFSKYGLKLFLVFSACVHGLQACRCSHVCVWVCMPRLEWGRMWVTVNSMTSREPNHERQERKLGSVWLS